MKVNMKEEWLTRRSVLFQERWEVGQYLLIICLDAYQVGVSE